MERKRSLLQSAAPGSCSRTLQTKPLRTKQGKAPNPRAATLVWISGSIHSALERLRCSGVSRAPICSNLFFHACICTSVFVCTFLLHMSAYQGHLSPVFPPPYGSSADGHCHVTVPCTCPSFRFTVHSEAHTFQSVMGSSCIRPAECKQISDHKVRLALF